MGNVLPELGDLLFSLVIGYLGALELLYVVRHVYHWTCGHARITPNDDDDGLERLQENYKERLSEAEQREAAAGNKLMADGIAYNDGFRVVEADPEIDELTAILRGDRALGERRRALEAELAEQRRVEAETRAQLEQAEAELARQRREAAEVEAKEQAERLLAAEREREAEQRKIEENKERERQENEENERQLKQRAENEERENERRVLEAERKREEEQRRREEEEEAQENERRIFEAERQREEAQRRREEEEESAQKLIESERLREEEQRRREEEAEKQRVEDEQQENNRRLLEAEQQREQEQRRHEEEEKEREKERRLVISKRQEENERQRQLNDEATNKLIEAEQRFEEQQREREVAEKNSNKLIDAEKRQEYQQRELEERKEDNNNVAKALLAEKQCDDDQRKLEDEEMVTVKSEKQLNATENRLNLKIADIPSQIEDATELAENENRIFKAEREREAEQRRLEEEQERADEEIVNRLLEAELLRQAQEEAAKEAQDRKQRLCEENARAFIEAEEKMIKLQHQMSESAAPGDFVGELELDIEPVIEEPCIKKLVERKFAPTENYNVEDNILDDLEPPCERITTTVKTQFGQASNEPYSLSTKPLLFPSLSDDGSSIEPNSSQQSSFSTQPSEEASTTVTDEVSSIKVQYPAGERQEPDGEDNTPLPTQLSEEYLRSLDGLNRPLVREDGSGRRRAFKKRRSGSNSSNSSRESRTSREEEVKMFTSLEEEEMHKAEHDGNNEFSPIKYSNEPGLLKVKHGHRRHHKRRSPVKDTTTAATPKTTGESNNGRGSLEMLGEESIDPWGEVVPEPYKNTEFWKREKTVSIDEENADADEAVLKEDVKDATNEEAKDDHKNTATNVPKTASFEEATPTQHEQALSVMKRKLSKDLAESESNVEVVTLQSETNANLRTSHSTSPPRSSASSRLRRSPRIDEMTHYERSFKQSQSVPNMPNTPTIVVESPSWRDDHGLLLEGISDFYDFTASFNRSRSVSRNPSPLNSAPSTPLPKNVSYTPNDELITKTSIDIYDDTGIIASEEFNEENIKNFITNIMVIEETISSKEVFKLENVCDDANRTADYENEIVLPAVYNNDVNDLNVTDLPMAHEQQQMEEMLQQLRLERSRSRSCSRSRSYSPLPTPENLQRSLETRRAKRIKQNDDYFEKLSSPSPEKKTLSESESTHQEDDTDIHNDNSHDNMNALVATLRAGRSRSRSRSPLPSPVQLERSLEMRRQKRIQQNEEILERLTEQSSRSLHLNKPSISIQSVDGAIIDEIRDHDEECTREEMSQLVASLRVARSRSCSRTPARLSQHREEVEQRYERARTPSRSLSRSPEHSDEAEDAYFHELLNLEASSNRTLEKNSEEAESLLAAKQHRVDAEALHALRNAQEEVELRTVTPLDLLKPPTIGNATAADAETEADDQLSELSTRERLRQLRCSPTTPEYERSISEEWRDVQRIKREQIAGNFKRSTYVGESMDLGSEYESLRRETAAFQRSRTPSPSFSRVETETCMIEKRHMQAEILAELAAATGDEDVAAVVEDVDLDELRREAVKFRRSRSNSRSPMTAADMQEIAQIEAEAAKRELQDKILDKLANTAGNFQNFSRHLNVNFLEHERRASDSLLLHHDDGEGDGPAMEPEEYHHFRRYSLAQEQPIEEYPEDEDYDVFELHSWASDDYDLAIYSDQQTFESKETQDDPFITLELNAEGEAQEAIELEVASDDDSEDERQTVVDVDDEIDEDFCDFVERNVTDESHHEQSECEEADREMDRYAGRGANDWSEVHDVNELLLETENGATAVNTDTNGLNLDLDSDSAVIDEIYDEAIRHRKQSGILRDYDSILRDMQNSYMDRNTGGGGSSNAGSESEGGYTITRNEQVASGRPALHDMRYLGDATSSARRSTRLRSRYGYVPQLQATAVEELDIIDLNYVPRREYNWRKNFKLDDDAEVDTITKSTPEATGCETEESVEPTEDYESQANGVELLDLRKYSLGGESITLFSRGQSSIDIEYDTTIGDATTYAEPEIEEKPQKKKRGKKKLRKDAKQLSNELNRDEDDSESQVYSRRSSSVQLDGATVDSPKARKSRSRRSSKTSLTNEESVGGYAESPLGDINEIYGAPVLTKKKTVKKRSKKTAKEVFSPAGDIDADMSIISAISEDQSQPPSNGKTISAAISPESTSTNVLSTLSPTQSLCATPPSIKSLSLDTTAAVIEETTSISNTTVSASAPATVVSTPVDTFDIMKDANFYPLF